MTVANSLSFSPEPRHKYPEQDASSMSQSLLKMSIGAKLNLLGIHQKLTAGATLGATLLPPERILIDQPAS
jgi:hypothetical protein